MIPHFEYMLAIPALAVLAVGALRMWRRRASWCGSLVNMHKNESWFTPLTGLTDFIKPYEVSNLKPALSHGATIGRGAYATVFLVQLESHLAPVVVKINKTRGSYGVEHLTYQEAAILAYLEGRAGAPRLVACDATEGVIVMEYLGPLELTDVIHQRRLRNDRECYELMLSLSKQVKELQDCGFVHADLKPNNILVSRAGRTPVAHLIDFGFATKLGRKSHIQGTRFGWEYEILKRPWYAAEIFKDELLDEKTDVVGLAYSINCMVPLLRRKNAKLTELIIHGMAHDRTTRPTVSTFIRFFENTLADFLTNL